MKLRSKFNLALLCASVVCLGVVSLVANKVLNDSARSSAVQNARVLMESAEAARQYTNANVVKLLQTQMRYTFLPESVPSFASSEILNFLHAKLPEYAYKDAMLNPTNPRDRVVDWEADVVNEFRNDAKLAEIVGERDTAMGRNLYLARPIRITDGNCLACHTTPEMAPKTMIDRYGPANGFGWKLNETVGAQIVSVPVSLQAQQARHTLYVFVGSIAAVFVVVFVTLNLMLRTLVTRPIERLSEISDRVSLGDEDAPEFQTSRRDEIGVLAQAFSRLRTSLIKAIGLIEGEPELVSVSSQFDGSMITLGDGRLGIAARAIEKLGSGTLLQG